MTCFVSPAGCKSDDECPQHLACIRRECQDPCRFERCGQNAQCSVRNHRAKCDCLPGYRGNPYEICRQYECLTDPECPTTKACRNEKCVDPCDCAINAHCTPRNHRGICACDSGYTGDPYGIECTKSKTHFIHHYTIYPFCSTGFYKTTSFQSLSLTLAVPLMESAQVNRPVSSKMAMGNVSTLVWNSGPVLEMQFVTSKMNYLSVS